MKYFTNTDNLKSKLLVLIFLLTSVLITNLYGQGTISDEDLYKGEVNRMTQIPTSPEASAFTKYGDTKVSLYTGTPQIGVPLYTYQGREYNLDFTLSYDASGVKVEQSAGPVGLSWSLQPGGRITRQVNGLPDDYISGSYSTLFNSQAVRDSMDVYLSVPNIFTDTPKFIDVSQAQNFLYFIYDINLNQIDAQRDFFKVNVENLNDTFVFDFENNQNVARSLSNPRLKIEPTIYAGSYIQSWKVTDEDGTEYYFEAEELTFRENQDADSGPDVMGDASVTYISSWLLTKIISANEKDIYEFSYKNEGYGPFEEFATSKGNNTTKIQAGQSYYHYSSAGSTTSAVRSNNQPLYLTQVQHNGDTIATLEYRDRYDFAESTSNSRLTNINIQDRFANPIRFIVFHNDNYFNRDGQTLTQLANHVTKEYYDIRLKLDSVEVKGAQGQLSQMFSFEYQNPDDLPSRFSYAQDYFGYYNGNNGNSTLIPHLETSGLTFEGGNREPDSASGRVGMLTKMTYPTGGYTEFEYEPHLYYTLEQTSQSISAVDMTLNSSSVTDAALYRDDEGQLCDDEFEGRNPKILIKRFFGPPTGTYTVELLGNNSEMDAYIVDISSSNENYSNYCEFYNESNAIWTKNSNYTTINLESGKIYKALLLLSEDNIGQYNSAHLSVSKDTSISNMINKPMGGNRIASISDYSKQGTLAHKKEYSYGETESTGILNYIPTVYEYRAADTETGEVEEIIRFGTYATGDEPHIVYSKVTEVQVDGFGNKLGKTDYTFFKGTKGSVPMTLPPYENNFYPDLRPGQLQKKEVLDENLQVLERDSINYFETVIRPVNVNSIVVRTNPDRYGKLVFLKAVDEDGDQTNDYVTFEYLPAFICDPQYAPVGTPGYCQPPPYIANPSGSGYITFMAQKYAPFSIRKTFANGAYGGVNYVRKEKLFGNGSLEVVVSEEITEYDDYSTGTKYLPSSKTTTNSMGQTVKTEYNYPHQNQVVGDQALVSKNNLVEVTRTVETLEPGTGTVDEEKLREYSKTYGVFGVAVLPSEVKLAKSDESEEIMYHLDYYAGGNIKEVHRQNGPSTFYIWGYDDTYPIAKIDNMEAGDITATIQTFIDAAVASSDLDDDRCYTTGCTEQDLLDDLQVLRNNLPPNVLMTTYTYDPQIGVTTITDTKGNTTYFEYDGLGRLINTKNEDFNLLNEYQYHFKGQN